MSTVLSWPSLEYFMHRHTKEGKGSKLNMALLVKSSSLFSDDIIKVKQMRRAAECKCLKTCAMCMTSRLCVWKTMGDDFLN